MLRILPSVLPGLQKEAAKLHALVSTLVGQLSIEATTSAAGEIRDALNRHTKATNKSSDQMWWLTAVITLAAVVAVLTTWFGPGS